MNLSSISWVISLLLVSIGILIALGARAQARLKKQYPPLGQMVDLGGYRLHVHVEGKGNPTVVFEAGAGGIGLSWELVRPAIARRTRVVVYDRAGLGWSEPSPCPREANTMAMELHTMLTKAKISGPYLLVGHSLGGPITRQFAAMYPDEVMGLVMVDSAHEQQVKYFPEPLVKMASSMKSMMGLMRVVGKIGLFALKPSLVSIGDNEKLPNQLAKQMRGVLAASNSHVDVLIAETDSVNNAQTQSVSTLGDLPLSVIRHGQLDASAIPPSLGQQVLVDYERAWQKLQEEIASLSTRSRLIVAEKSGHNIMYDQPEIIIEAVLEMLSTTRGQIQSSLKDTVLAK